MSSIFIKKTLTMTVIIFSLSKSGDPNTTIHEFYKASQSLEPDGENSKLQCSEELPFNQDRN
jgi:hypothetical protein